jgi:hypothetical protein
MNYVYIGMLLVQLVIVLLAARSLILLHKQTSYERGGLGLLLTIDTHKYESASLRILPAVIILICIQYSGFKYMSPKMDIEYIYLILSISLCSINSFISNRADKKYEQLQNKRI